MRPYIDRMGHRPGCNCCNTKRAHHHRPQHGDRSVGVKLAKRSGKKAVRQNNKKLIKEEL